MLPDFDYQTNQIVLEQPLPEQKHNHAPSQKKDHKWCCQVGSLLIRLGTWLTAVGQPPDPDPNDLQLA